MHEKHIHLSVSDISIKQESGFIFNDFVIIPHHIVICIYCVTLYETFFKKIKKRWINHSTKVCQRRKCIHKVPVLPKCSATKWYIPIWQVGAPIQMSCRSPPPPLVPQMKLEGKQLLSRNCIEQKQLLGFFVLFTEKGTCKLLTIRVAEPIPSIEVLHG